MKGNGMKTKPQETQQPELRAQLLWCLWRFPTMPVSQWVEVTIQGATLSIFTRLPKRVLWSTNDSKMVLSVTHRGACALGCLSYALNFTLRDINQTRSSGQDGIWMCVLSCPLLYGLKDDIGL